MPNSSTADPAFVLDGVGVSFASTRALKQVGLTIGTGEAVALVGPSGSGKTTLLRLLNGMLRADQGSVHSLGEEVGVVNTRRLRELRARIAFIPQDRGLVPNLSVVQNVLLGRVGRRSLLGALRDMMLPPKPEEEAIHALLERVGLPEKIFDRVDTLSGGQKQRVALARALYQDPRAILADEPVSSLDPARARDLVGLLLEVAREGGLTLVTSIHQLDLALEFFPRVVGLRGGKIVFDGPPSALGEKETASLYDLSQQEMGKE